MLKQLFAAHLLLWFHKTDQCPHLSSAMFENSAKRDHMDVDTATKDQNQGLVRDVRALLRNCIFGITPDRDGM